MLNLIREYKLEIAYVVATLAILVLGTAIDISNWNECRAHGFSVLFCLSI